MTDNPNPQDDEEWTINDQKPEEELSEEPLEGEAEQEVLDDEYSGGEAGTRQTLAENYEAIKEDVTKRDFVKGLGVGALGIGLLGAGAYAANEARQTDGVVGDGTPGDGDMTYMVGDVEVDIDSLRGLYEDSEVTMGVQPDGNLVAWNTNVVNDDANNPLWRFRSDRFPDREHFTVSGEHPLEELYEASDAAIEEMSEDMVNVFYNAEEEGGTWEDHQDYKEVDFDELTEGLTEYGSVGQAQDYFFNRRQTLSTGEPALEGEWQQLLRDSQ